MSTQKNPSEIKEYKSSFANDCILLPEFTHSESGELDYAKVRSVLESKFSHLSEDEILEIYNVTVAYANFLINLYYTSL
jgi:hypothetical protein